MKKLGFLSLLLLAVCTLFACSGQKNASSDSSKLKVVATNSIIADITKNIAGDKIDLHSIVPVGKDPTNTSPCPKMSKRLLKQTSSSTMVST